jgi:2-polyprenyl-3-methyl-5-hydroxy-6-metoxy-1,4-benzoquinol methylase
MYTARDLLLADWPLWYHAAAIENMPAASGRLLDVGCGTGAFVAAALQKGFDAYGIDLSARAIEAGRRHFGIEHLYEASVDGLKDRFDKQFDVVTAFEVLEHMDDAERFLAQLIELVAPGGHLILSVPNRDRRPRLLNEGDLPPHHFTRWNEATVRGFLERNGLLTTRVIVCPARTTLKAWILHSLHFHLVIRMLRIAEAARNPQTSGRTASYARWLARLKDRLADAAAAVLALPLSPFLRGPMLVAFAQLPDRPNKTPRVTSETP